MSEERRQQKALLGVTIGHAAHDAWFGVAPILLASLSVTMGLTNSEIGLTLLLYQLFSSVTQPFFGRLSERIGGRALAVGAILWTTALFSGTLFADTRLVLMVLIALAGFGSGAWHPQGAANATVSGGERWGATAASIFFLGGTGGTAFLGSLLGGYLLDAYGRPALLLISGITVILALFVVRRLVPRELVAAKRTSARSQQRNGIENGSALYILVGFLLLATAFRSFAFHSLTTYIPKYQQDLGATPAVYGLLMSLFLIAGAVGGVLGSYLADRVGIRLVLAGSMALAAAFFLGFVRLEGVASYASFVMAGLLVGPSHTLLIVAGQRQFPQRMAMISGILLGFTFVTGAGGAWILGLLADRVGLGTMLGTLPWVLLAATVCSLVAVPRPSAAASPDDRRSVPA